MNERSFFATYTPANIWAEIGHRLAGWRSRRPVPPAPPDVPVDVAGHAARVGRFYDERHDQFMAVYGDVIQAFRTTDVAALLDYQSRRMALAPGQRLLDAGCGVGAPAVHFAQHAGVRVDAITISPVQHAAATARVRAAGLAAQVSVVLGDYHALDRHFAPGSYDVVCFLESFGHSRAKAALIDVCWRMLKPGGLLYIKDLFVRLPLAAAHAAAIDREIARINAAYHYEVASLNEVLDAVRRRGFVPSLSPVNLEVTAFENLAISNRFQELTGLAPIQNWDEYVFPVDFFELSCRKPEGDLLSRLDQHVLQQALERRTSPASSPP